jgi:hypothetical protein
MGPCTCSFQRRTHLSSLPYYTEPAQEKIITRVIVSSTTCQLISQATCRCWFRKQQIKPPIIASHQHPKKKEWFTIRLPPPPHLWLEWIMSNRAVPPPMLACGCTIAFSRLVRFTTLWMGLANWYNKRPTPINALNYGSTGELGLPVPFCSLFWPHEPGPDGACSDVISFLFHSTS